MAFEKFNEFFGMSEENSNNQSNNQEISAVSYEENDKIIPMSGSPKATSKISIINPTSYDDAKKIATEILKNKAVIVNFSDIDDEQAKRIVDFLSGSVYSIDGKIKRVGDKIFLCTPPKFEVSDSEILTDSTNTLS